MLIKKIDVYVKSFTIKCAINLQILLLLHLSQLVTMQEPRTAIGSFYFEEILVLLSKSMYTLSMCRAKNLN